MMGMVLISCGDGFVDCIHVPKLYTVNVHNLFCKVYFSEAILKIL